MKSLPALPKLALALLLAATTRTAGVQNFGAQSTLFDSSVRLSGMGRTGAAVFWGGDLNDWANPAVLPYNPGLRFERSKTQLVPELANDVFFTTNRVLVGRWGVGLAIAGLPLNGAGNNKLDYGESVATDVDGNELGRFRTTEKDNAIGVGVSAAQAIRSLGIAWGHRLPPVDRFADVSVGHTWKQVKYRDEGTMTFLGSSDVHKRDRGYLVRLTPYDAIGYPGLLSGVERFARVRMDLSYGASELNYDDHVVHYSNGTTLPAVEDHRHASAYHVAVALRSAVKDDTRKSWREWLYDLATPILSYGWTNEHSQRYLYGSASGSEVRETGWELTVANIFSYRKGHIDDPTTTIVGDTSGWGVGLHLGESAGVQYDHAKVPQSIYLGDVKRNGFYVYVDPAKVVGWVR